MPRAARLRSRAYLFLRGALFFALLALVVRYGWEYETTLRPMRLASEAPHPFTIEPGESAESIGEALYRLGLVPHPLVFRVYLLERGDGAKLRAGEYLFQGTLTLRDVVNQLVRGEVARHDVTFPEGRSVEEMAEIVATKGIAKEAFRGAAREATLVRDLDPQAADLEGYLFPDTYDVSRRSDAASVLVARMVQRFREVATPLVPRFAERGLDVRKAVTLASLVELETARADERSRIAAVFLNRLKIGMPLQTDPTVIYGIVRSTGRFDGNLHRSDLRTDTPWNTYTRRGLPPGPIASPGIESIRAALEPARVPYLYFVSRNDGTHVFSTTLGDHTAAVRRYQGPREAER
jgi:UPF0755 protein